MSTLRFLLSPKPHYSHLASPRRLTARWTGGVDADEYVEFLKELWTRVATGTSELDYRWKPYPLIEYWPRKLAIDPDEPQGSVRRQSATAGRGLGKGGAQNGREAKEDKVSKASHFPKPPVNRASQHRPTKGTPVSRTRIAEEAAATPPTPGAASSAAATSPRGLSRASSSAGSTRVSIQRPVASCQLQSTPPSPLKHPMRQHSPQQTPPPPSLLPTPSQHSCAPLPTPPPVSPELRRPVASAKSFDSHPHALRAYWIGDVVHGSWAVRIERSRLNTGFMLIGVCDFHGDCAWGLHPFSGLLYRLCRHSDGRYSFNTPPPYGYPDGNHVRVMRGNLQGRVNGAVIESIVHEDTGTLSFSINGAPPLVALSGFPRGTQLRQWTFVVDRGDLVSPIRVVR